MQQTFVVVVVLTLGLFCQLAEQRRISSLSHNKNNNNNVVDLINGYNNNNNNYWAETTGHRLERRGGRQQQQRLEKEEEVSDEDFEDGNEEEDEEDDDGSSAMRSSSSSSLSRVPKSTVSEVMGCKKLPALQIFKQLNAVCEDCFQLFREQEVYHMCRSDCFGSDYFIGCMDYLIYAKDHITKIAGLVEDIHEYVRK